MTAAVHPPPTPTKATWTDADYPIMAWHDCRIHGISLAGHDELLSVRLMIDLDYIVRWVDPVAPEQHLTFWIAPATLVFENAWGVCGEFGPVFEQLEIADIHRLDPTDDHPSPSWHVEGENFGFHLRATGFRQYLRRAPQLVHRKVLTSAERGGVSFAEESFG
ncbi:hypothetical protein KOI35_44345 [Actinoplanes bogorensis]|uniref:Uncharacterized protein n=1 Tax=Paractinoplanes bogorensis TaxID=1610840 RepID=A0ABS5Z4E1_9ACTN|nr:hypothetical protein [Actinoplanes bogorensis]MBU2670554.1 hypothetical protein [Actinoplanes bogorensis]